MGSDPGDFRSVWLLTHFEVTLRISSMFEFLHLGGSSVDVCGRRPFCFYSLRCVTLHLRGWLLAFLSIAFCPSPGGQDCWRLAPNKAAV